MMQLGCLGRSLKQAPTINPNLHPKINILTRRRTITIIVIVITQHPTNYCLSLGRDFSSQAPTLRPSAEEPAMGGLGLITAEWGIVLNVYYICTIYVNIGNYVVIVYREGERERERARSRELILVVNIPM